MDQQKLNPQQNGGISQLVQQMQQLPAENTQEPVYLMEAEDGMLVRVPESKLETWQQSQSEDRPLTEQERLLKERIVSMLYGT